MLCFETNLLAVKHEICHRKWVGNNICVSRPHAMMHSETTVKFFRGCHSQVLLAQVIMIILIAQVS